MSLDSNQQEIIKKLKTTSTITSSTTSPPSDSDSDSNANSITSSNPSSSKSKSKSKAQPHSTNIHPSNRIHQTETNHHQSNTQSNSNSNLSSNSNSNLSSKRLTRSTYIGDEDHSNSNRKRSSSSDSENGWIPPPPLLPLQTEFLITNQLSNSSLIQSIHQTTNNTHHTLRLAHLKCPDSSDHLDTTSSLETPSFRLIHESELLLGSKRNKSESIQMIKNQPIGNGNENENENQASNLIFLKKHKTYEMLEKRSKRLEKEKLIHERFKLKSHLNLLKNPMGIDWKTVRSITLRRIKEEERRINQNLNHLDSTTDHQQHQVSLGNDGERENEKVERMRWIMVKEAQETLERYDKLLDTRKPVIKARQVLPPPPPPLISIPETTLPINSPQSTSSPPIMTHKRQLPASDRNVSKRSKTKIGESEEPVTRPLHISLKLKAPIPKPSTSVSKTKIKIKPKGTMSSNTKQPKVETESSSSEGEEEETEEEEERSVSEVSEEPNRKRTKRSASLKPSTKEPHPAGSIVVPIKGRESLYESENLRRMILEDGLIVGGERRRKVGRKVYGFGVKVPELKSIKFESYLIRLDSMSLQQGLKYSPFLNLNEVLPSTSSSSSSSLSVEENKKEGNVVQDDDEFGKDWIEFDPRLEEIKALVTKRDEFGMNSGYFDLVDELEGLEDEMKLKGEGKSLRRLMWERVVLSKEEIND